ncbi:uncharacterized protein CANTADRAFT_88953 [Suhomyces tanzawaensis NRRL Y-17324]|uniref:Transcription factor MBP1 n=1 Tax=Suhomyces tanzawaensis NRRL Y-17324 TaxID=984487 RepID=A0A1E4SNG5_9ASCO|nr:uncharacterized protein CANTADRAFT_88953 [Suhomyces tanzawaensis NRRL Y-17324]ODV81053.1 hypothetical protein CANTADRAFT_88953 [Suhomyces tanzawaensis NRRL Y-17324]
MSNTQIYSATYSNVPVFEFVTSEGPIMRRKLDSWINATHILKIAKFPKAKRTRILEKDVQTGIHEKVQGGYGKYQGTYVPLDLGADIARNFGVFEVLRPIFEFQYVEGKSETPPPAPKHNHASALNIAKRQASTGSMAAAPARKTKSVSSLTGEPPKKRGRPRRVVLNSAEPKLKHSDTTPIEPGPSIGTFNNRGSFSSHSPQPHPATLLRQDTEQDALQVMTSNMNLKNDDLELVQSDEDDDDADVVVPKSNGISNHLSIRMDSQGDELMNTKELFGTPRDSFEKIIQSRSNFNNHNGHSQVSHDPYSLLQYHQPSLAKVSDTLYSEYFSNLLTYFLDDSKIRSDNIPDRIAIPPQPIAKININQAIDNDGNTLFHWACSMANISMVEFLMSTFEISPEVRNNHGETPLMFLIKFNNSYQLKNFPTILQLLLESILSVDNTGKTVLHHIAAIDNDKKNKERFSRYYLETIFDKLVETLDDDEQVEDNGGENEVDNKETIRNNKDLITKFTNHQDSDGNTAFHIAAYSLNKKCIKVFISYHKYIDFTLRNLVSYTVEDYLASHNFVLRLGHEEIAEGNEDLDEGLVNQVNNGTTHSFESELYNSKMAVNLQNTTSNLITEKLTELAYTIDKELSEKDEVILSLFKILKVTNQGKLESQKKVLSFFKLDHLIEDLEKALKNSNPHDLVIDSNKDRVIQEEISRVVNDLSYLYLTKKNELDEQSNKYHGVQEKLQMKQLEQIIQQELNHNQDTQGDQFEKAVELTGEVIKRQRLLRQVLAKQLELVPQTSKDGDAVKVENGEKPGIVSKYPQEDKLHKYCKLISLCCGMNVGDVESSIDLIEQSLLKGGK